MRVFVAGPYTADADDLILCNVLTACKAAAKLVEAGLCPFVPHLSHYIDRCCETYLDYETWMKQTLQWVSACDGLLRLPGVSPGADREVELALDLGLPVFRTVQAVVDYAAKAQHFWKATGETQRAQPCSEVARDEAEAVCTEAPFKSKAGYGTLVTSNGDGSFTITNVRLF